MKAKALLWFAAFVATVGGLVGLVPGLHGTTLDVAVLGGTLLLGGLAWLLRQWDDESEVGVGAVAAAVFMAAGVGLFVGAARPTGRSIRTVVGTSSTVAPDRTTDSTSTSTSTGAGTSTSTTTSAGTSSAPPNRPTQPVKTIHPTRVGQNDYIDLDTMVATTQSHPNEEVQWDGSGLNWNDPSASPEADIAQLAVAPDVKIVPYRSANPSGCRNASDAQSGGSLTISDVQSNERICVSTTQGGWAILTVVPAPDFSGTATFAGKVYTPRR